MTIHDPKTKSQRIWRSLDSHIIYQTALFRISVIDTHNIHIYDSERERERGERERERELY